MEKGRQVRETAAKKGRKSREVWDEEGIAESFWSFQIGFTTLRLNNENFQLDKKAQIKQGPYL